MRSLIFVLFSLLLLGCATATKYAKPTYTTSPSPTATAKRIQDQSDVINRPTSKPYTGDLSIFEDPKRDEKLQINRIVDILGIKNGVTVADIGAGSGWFSVRAARRV
jgi:predicted methyltransferase